MPKLILSMDGLVLKEIQLKKERTTVGRKAHNDIQIDNLAISGEHAVITTILSDAFLEDCNSTNGTYVNGQAVRKAALHNGDVIELGKYRLKFLADPAPVPGMIDSAGLSASSGPEVQERDVVSFKELETQVLLKPEESAQGTLAAELPDGRVGMIRVLTGPNEGRELELQKALTKLGKPGYQVAVISRRPQGFYVTHVEGDTRAVLNGSALGDEALRLRDRDILDIAGVKMEFVLRT